MRLAWGGLALLWISATGCDRAGRRRAEACGALSGVIAPASEQLARLSDLSTAATPQDAEASLRALADLARQVAEQVAATPLSAEEAALSAQAEQYVRMCQALEEAANAMAALLQAAVASTAQVDALTQEALPAALRGLAEACSGTPEAAACAEVVRRVPSDLGDPAALEAYPAAVRAADLRGSPAVAAAASHLLSVAERLREAQKEAKDLAQRASDLGQRMEGIRDQEAAAVAGLNRTCQEE